MGRGKHGMKRLREPVNGITHLAGAVLAVVAMVVLVGMAAVDGNVEQVFGFSVFGASMVGLYLASALYHILPLPATGVPLWRRIDHMMIYVLIAGTYTPICLVALRGAWGWAMLVLVWSLALLGIVFKVCWMHAPGWLSMSLYLLIGWVAIIAMPEVYRSLPTGATVWIVVGGLVYTMGALVLGLKRPNPVPGVFGFHELWHLFVLAGSACYFWVMVRYIAPMG
jgi:hemolysin III